VIAPSPFDVGRLRPRDALAFTRLAPDDARLAALRLRHPGGVPTSTPTHWIGAFVRCAPGAVELVAAVGWLEEKHGFRMVTEVDRAGSRWGTVGVLSIIEKLIAASKRDGIRLQALILPKNARLKDALTRAGGRCMVEIWEATDEPEASVDFDAPSEAEG
jgi:hypothetical protein